MKKYVCTVKCWHSQLSKMFTPGMILETGDDETAPSSFALVDEKKQAKKEGGTQKKTDAEPSAPPAPPSSGPQGPNQPPPAKTE